MTTVTARAGRRLDLAGYAAAAWAAAYGTVALFWTLTGNGFPFGSGDPDGEASVLRGLPADVGAPLFAVILLAAAVAALVTTGHPAVRPAAAPRAVVLGFGWTVVAALLAVVPDMRLLVRLGYAPILILGAPFGWPDVDYSEIFTWQVANMAVCVAGGLLLARALLVWQFRTTGACVSCGRSGRTSDWASAAAAARWGRRAAYTAAVIPSLYALSRFGWAASVLLGFSDLDEFDDDAVIWGGAALGAFAVVGSVLTLGLVQRWGEVFPRWLPGLAGRRVPVKLAVVPATLVTISVLAASQGLFRSQLPDKLASDDVYLIWPMLLWPVWGVALGAATLAYYLRRRGACAQCGQDG